MELQVSKDRGATSIDGNTRNELTPSPFGIREARRFKAGVQLDNAFHKMWANGEPFVVERAMSIINPQQFMDIDKSRDLMVTVELGDTGETATMSWQCYFDRWTKAEAKRETLKVKVGIQTFLGYYWTKYFYRITLRLST